MTKVHTIMKKYSLRSTKEYNLLCSTHFKSRNAENSICFSFILCSCFDLLQQQRLWTQQTPLHPLLAYEETTFLLFLIKQYLLFVVHSKMTIKMCVWLCVRGASCRMRSGLRTVSSSCKHVCDLLKWFPLQLQLSTTTMLF